MSWFEEEDIWSLLYEWMFSPESFEQAIEQVDDIIKLSGITTGTVLDLCCGPGRHSIPLRKLGFDVTSVDLQAMHLSKAQEYAAQENVTIEFIKEDMLTFKRAQSFDLVVSMFSSFGYFGDPQDDFKVLENAYYSLNSGGRILLDVRGKEIQALEQTDTLSFELPNDAVLFQRNRPASDWASMTMTFVYVRGDQAKTQQGTFNLYSGVEMRELLQKAGFRNVQIYGSLKGIPYDQHAKRLVLVAEKP